MIKRIAQAWGFAAILLLPGYVDLTSSLGDERMHVPWPLTRLVLAQLVDLAIVGLIFAALMAILRNLKSWARIRWFALAFLPIYLLVCNLRIFPFRVQYISVAIAAVAWIAILAFLVFRAPGMASKLYGFGGAVLTGSVVFAFVMTAQLVSAAFWRPGIQAFAAPFPRSLPPVRAWFGSSSTSWHTSRYSRLAIAHSIFPTSIGYVRKVRCTPT